jgi:acyl-CoA thioesterase
VVDRAPEASAATPFAAGWEQTGWSPELAARHAAEAGAFDRDTAVQRLPARGVDGSGAGEAGEVSFAAEVSPFWRAGRGPHGGYLAALILRALIDAVADRDRAPRSLTIHYARAPTPGPVIIRVVHERRGRSLSTLSTRMEQGGAVVALALAAFSVPWKAPEMADVAMPEVAAPDRDRETTPELLRRVDQGLAPQFLRQIVLQVRLGASMPFAGAEGKMEVGAWFGVGDRTRPVDATSLALFSDALFSPPFVRLSRPATSPTVDLTIHFRAPLHAETPGRLCFGHFRSRLVHEGFFDEDGEIWSADGRLLAHSRQLAIMMPLGSG